MDLSAAVASVCVCVCVTLLKVCLYVTCVYVCVCVCVCVCSPVTCLQPNMFHPIFCGFLLARVELREGGRVELTGEGGRDGHHAGAG